MATGNGNVVEVVGLSIVRGRRAILHEINLQLSEGESVALMGANGAGKSTLLSCLAGSLRPTRGVIHGPGGKDAFAARARRIGFVGHEAGLYDELTALENLVFAARMSGLGSPVPIAQSLLGEAGVESVAQQQVGRLSQGLRRRIAIARALVPDPALILLDEPFACVDRVGRAWLVRLFHRWRAGKRTVCFASHDVEESRRLADRIIWLDAGRLAAEERIDRIPTTSRRSA
jgi:ABC-type multidrug transport system ATPase subunit